jgi:hypothetical protein
LAAFFLLGPRFGAGRVGTAAEGVSEEG